MHMQVARRKAVGGVWRTQVAKHTRGNGSGHAGVEFLAQQPHRAAVRALSKDGID